MQALVASSLPFNLRTITSVGCSVLCEAALAASCPTAKVQLLRQAGAPRPTPQDLLSVIDRLSVPGLTALLTVGRPAVYCSQPVLRMYYDTLRYSCPIHRALRGLVRCQKGGPQCLGAWVPCLAVPSAELHDEQGCRGQRLD